MARNLQPVLVRLEPNVKAQLQEQAKAERRPLSNYCAYILSQHCEDTEKPAKPRANGAHKSAARVPA